MHILKVKQSNIKDGSTKFKVHLVDLPGTTLVGIENICKRTAYITVCFQILVHVNNLYSE